MTCNQARANNETSSPIQSPRQLPDSYPLPDQSSIIAVKPRRVKRSADVRLGFKKAAKAINKQYPGSRQPESPHERFVAQSPVASF